MIYAAADIVEVDEDIELHTGDMEKLDPSAVMELATSDIDISDLTDESPNPTTPHRAPGPGAVVPRTEKNPPRGAPSCSRSSRFAGPSARFRVRRRRPDPDRSAERSRRRGADIEESSEPAPRIVKAQKLPLDEFPSEKSVVSRIVKSVVAALPSAIRKAVDKTGQHMPCRA